MPSLLHRQSCCLWCVVVNCDECQSLMKWISPLSHSFFKIVFAFSESPSAFAPSFPIPLSENHFQTHNANPFILCFISFLIHFPEPSMSMWCSISAFHPVISSLHHQSGCLLFINVFFLYFQMVSHQSKQSLTSQVEMPHFAIHSQWFWNWFGAFWSNAVVWSFLVLQQFFSFINMWNPKTPQIEMQKCCVDFQWFTQHFRSFITQFVVCHRKPINHHSLLQSSITLNSQTLQHNCCQSGVWFQHFTQCNCPFNPNRVICSSFIKFISLSFIPNNVS